MSELEREFDTAIATDEFERYREKEAEIRAAFLAHAPELTDALDEVATALAEQQDDLDNFPWSVRNAMSVGLGPLRHRPLLSFGLVAGGLMIGVASFLGFPALGIWALGFAVIALAVSMIFIIATGVYATWRIHLSFKEQVMIAEGLYSAQLTNAVQQTLG